MNNRIWRDCVRSPKGAESGPFARAVLGAPSATSIAMQGRVLSEMREILQPGDALLLGTDLEKSIELQLLAYDDPAA